MLDIICIFTVLNQNSQSAAKLPIMQIKQIKEAIDNAKLLDGWAIEFSPIDGESAMVAVMRDHAGNGNYSMDWRGCNWEPDFAWEFQKALAHCNIKQ